MLVLQSLPLIAEHILCSPHSNKRNWRQRMRVSIGVHEQGQALVGLLHFSHSAGGGKLQHSVMCLCELDAVDFSSLGFGEYSRRGGCFIGGGRGEIDKLTPKKHCTQRGCCPTHS